MSEDNIVTKRIVAFIIDFILITFIAILAVFILLPFISNETFQVTSQVNAYLNLIFFAIPLFKDSFIKRSIGKRIMGLKIYNSNGIPLKYWQVLLRNITLPIWIIEVIVFLSRKDKKRLGDLLARTYVSSK
jgi:uncharacterized RDD family membrane protein YckC